VKHHLRDLIAAHRLKEIAELARARSRILGDLTALTYDADLQVAWRAVEAMGLAAAGVAEKNPERVREHLRRLLWSLREEAGAICWHAPEAMAEIVRMCEPAFAEYVPIVTHLLVDTAEEDLAHFRPGMLWAIGRLGHIATDQVADVLPAMLAALDHADPQVRGMAVWALGRVGQTTALAVRAGLHRDDGKVRFYNNGTLSETTVRAIRENQQ
jgi:AraC family transcriptional regulator, regulatory protein of adaptative response / methylated-DNA-[protein]-cysteine methyltransferase